MMVSCGQEPGSWLLAPAVVLVAVLAVGLTDIPQAAALWSASTAPGGAGITGGRTMTPGNEPAASTQPSTGNTVLVSWAASTGGPVEGYEVSAFDATTGEPRSVGGGCAGVVTGTSCTDADVPNGQWRYAVTPRRASWVGTQSTQSTPTWVDTIAPTVEMQFPEPGGAYNADSWNAGCPSPGACGIGDDVGSGLVSGGLTAQQASTGLYWDGTAFNSPVEVLLQVTGGSLGFNVWDFPVDNFPQDGVYTISATATDAVGNTTTDSATFTIDREGPTTPTGFPVDGGVYGADLWHSGCPSPGFCGAATEVGGTPVISAAVSVQQVDTGLYWDGTAFTSPTEVLLPATDPAGFPFPLDNFPTDGSYTTTAVLTDLAENVTRTAATYRIDRVTPVLSPIFPIPGGTYDAASWDAGCPDLSGLCGGATDDSGLVAAAFVSVRQVATGLFWDGSGFTSFSELLLPATDPAGFAFPATNFPTDGQYAARAVARDQAGNVASLSDTFTIDRTAPVITASFPLPGGIYNAAAWDAGCPTPGFCGTATDETSGIAYIRVSLRQDATGLYWTGTAFTSPTETFISLTNGEPFPFPATNFPADGSYTSHGEIADFAGNVTGGEETFTIDRTAPTMTLTFPVAGGSYNATKWNAGCPTAGVCGTITDPTSGVTTGQVSIRQGTGNYWNGTAFASATEMLLPFSNTAGTPFPFANFTTDGSYTVRGTASDPAGNTVSVSRTFTIDRARPTVTALTEANANGLLAAGDSYSITFSEALDVSTICSAWSGTGNQSLGNATITMNSNGNNDQITSVTTPTCTLHAATMNTHNDYVFSNATFTSSTVSWTESTRVLKITFGNRASGSVNVIPSGADTSDLSPSALLTDRAGNTLATSAFSAPNVRF
jgi:hypothetical protein